MTLNPAASPQDTDSRIQEAPETDVLRVVDGGNTGFSTNVSATEIPIENQRDEDLDDANPDEAILANPQWGGMATLAAAASFGAVVPSAVAAAYANHFWNVEKYGEASISNGGGTLENYFKEMFVEVGEDKDKDKESGWDEYAEIMQQTWEQNMHSFAGMEISGQEAAQIGEELSKDSWLRRQLIEKMMSDGMTKQEAEKKTQTIAEAYTGMGLPEAKRTEEQKRAIEDVNQSPELSKYAQWTSTARAQGLTVQNTPAIPKYVSGSMPDSIASSSDIFASAPQLTAEHRKATAALEPLDAKLSETNGPTSNLQVRSNITIPAPS